MKHEIFKKLTWNDIQDWAGDTIASRGRGYQHSHRVQELVRTPSGGMIAWVRGTQNYTTLVDIEDGELTAVCSCPYDGVCKHAVAVLLDYMDKVKQNIPIPTIAEGDQRITLLRGVSKEEWDDDDEKVKSMAARITPGDLHSYLEKQSKAELIRLLEDMSQRFPAVHDALQDRYHLLKGDVAKLVKAVRKEIDKLGAGPEPDWRGDWNAADPNYSGIRDRLEMLLEKGYADEVVEMGNGLLAAGNQQIEMVDDEGESIQEVASCLDIVFKALSMSSLLPADRMLWAVEAELQDEYDFCSGAAVFWEQTHATADWNILAEKLLQRLKKSSPNKGEDRDSRDYRRDRLTDWVITALVKAGRRDEVIALCEQEAERTQSYVRLVNYLVEEDRHEEAERWIRRGIKATQSRLPGIASHLHDILCQMREQGGDWIGVAALHADDFFADPSLDTLRKLQKSAEQAGVWSAVHAAAMHFLKTGELPDNSKEKATPDGAIPPWPLPDTGLRKTTNRISNNFPITGTLIDIAIAENRPDEVIRWYDLSTASKSRWYQTWLQEDRIAQAIAEAYPERAVGIWKKLAEDCIAQTQPKAYQQAADYLLCVRNTLQTMEKETEWYGYLTGLRQKNARKRRLIETLDAIDKRR
ncbi:MAG: SWIM zinc finger domain-containing protein [Chloroflexi bacterium]|nr:SWIM zinc finger domain-containing protein [Chloroflexota bacterium]